MGDGARHFMAHLVPLRVLEQDKTMKQEALSGIRASLEKFEERWRHRTKALARQALVRKMLLRGTMTQLASETGVNEEFGSALASPLELAPTVLGRDPAEAHAEYDTERSVITQLNVTITGSCLPVDAYLFSSSHQNFLRHQRAVSRAHSTSLIADNTQNTAFARMVRTEGSGIVVVSHLLRQPTPLINEELLVALGVPEASETALRDGIVTIFQHESGDVFDYMPTCHPLAYYLSLCFAQLESCLIPVGITDDDLRHPESLVLRLPNSGSLMLTNSLMTNLRAHLPYEDPARARFWVRAVGEWRPDADDPNLLYNVLSAEKKKGSEHVEMELHVEVSYMTFRRDGRGALCAPYLDILPSDDTSTAATDVKKKSHKLLDHPWVQAGKFVSDEVTC